MKVQLALHKNSWQKRPFYQSSFKHKHLYFYLNEECLYFWHLLFVPWQHFKSKF